jgi:hypothetical protein
MSIFRGIAGALGANKGGIAGLLQRLRQRKSGMSGPRGRLKNLETRVKNLEGNNSENPSTIGAVGGAQAGAVQNLAQAARSPYVQGTVPQAASTVTGALGGGGLGIEAVSGVGQFNPGTMQVDNNALSSDPLEGINKVSEIISAPGPMTNSQDELAQLFEN